MIKKFEAFSESHDLIGKRIKLISMRGDYDPIEPGTEGTIKYIDDAGTIHVNWDNGRRLGVIPNFDKYEILNESDAAGGASTTGVVGSGTAVGGGAQGSFVSSAGQAVYGGDSGTAFATNSNTAGMGDIISPQPSSIPGDVRGGTKGSGDIGHNIGTFSKLFPKKKKKKNKKDRKYTKAAENIDQYYTTKYTETYSNGKIITNWNVFTESKKYEGTVKIGGLYAFDLEEKGNYNQTLTDIYLGKSRESFYKLGQIRTLGNLVIFYPTRSIETGNLLIIPLVDLKGIRGVTEDEENIIIEQLKKDKYFPRNLKEDSMSYIDKLEKITGIKI